MRVPEEILESVAFLVTKKSGDHDCDKVCRGTAFFVSVRSEASNDWGFAYLVTAKHNITKAREYGLEVYVRLNTTEGKSEDIRIEDKWTFHEDPSVDLAVLPFSPGAPYWYRPISPKMQADEERINDLGIGIGDEIVISGLFSRRTGREKNLPIVRFGNIAAMPGELLTDSITGLNYRAYLIEARSFGGLSGSPVFVYFGSDRMVPGGAKEEPPLGYRMLILLGILRGHWEHQESIPFASAFRDELEKINWGIAVVTPATELKSILFSEPFAKQREQMDRQYLNRDMSVDDVTEDKGEHHLHKNATPH